MGNRDSDLCTVAGLQPYWDHRDLVRWFPWLESCKGGIQVFRKDGMGRQGRGVALYSREQPVCRELCLGLDEETTEISLWVRIKERTGKGDIIVNGCCRPPNQEEQVDQAL